jgi:pseudaminic acid cytidylyltransferase
MIFGANAAPVMLPRHRVQDIDTAEDWQRAEHLFRVLNPDSGTGQLPSKGSSSP